MTDDFKTALELYGEKNFLEYSLKLLSEREEWKQKAEKLESNLITWKAISKSDDLIDMGELAKLLANPKYGRTRLLSFLRSKNILRHNNHPYQKYVDAKYFKLVEENWVDKSGNSRIYLKTVCTQSGLHFVREKIDSETGGIYNVANS